MKNAAKEASRDLKSSERLTASGTAPSGKRRKLDQELRVELEQLEHEILTEGAHCNFPHKLSILTPGFAPVMNSVPD